MTPTGLKPGHLLLYKGTDWLGNTIDFFENGVYCHAALYYGNGKIVRQNPGGPAFEDADAQPWDRIDVRVLDFSGLKGCPADPHSDPVWISCFEAAVKEHMQDQYDYAAIAEFMDESRLKNLGLTGLLNLEREHQVPFADNHHDVCSAFDIIVDQEATRNSYKWPDFKLDPRTPEDQERPIDLASIVLTKPL